MAPECRMRLFRYTRFWRAVASLVVFCAFWQAIVSGFQLPPYLLPPPLTVLETLYIRFDVIAWHASITFSEIILGLIFGISLGVLTGILMCSIPALRSGLRPVIIFSQAMPIFAFAPIINFWLGFGMASKVFIAMLMIYFPVTSAFFDGLMRTNPGLIDLARIYGASKAQILWRIRLPAALPALLSGVQVAAVFAPMGAIIGEWVGAYEGLGVYMLRANGRAQIDAVFAAGLVLACVSAALWGIASLLAQRLAPWANRVN